MASQPDRAEHPPVGVGVGSEPGRRRVDVALEEHGRAVVERMADRERRLDPPQALGLEVRLAEEGRNATEGIDRAADVVDVAGQRQLGGSDATADRRRRLVQPDRVALPSQRDRRREPIGPGPDDDGVHRSPARLVGELRARHGHAAFATTSSRDCVRRIGPANIPAGVRTHHAPVSRSSRQELYR